MIMPISARTPYPRVPFESWPERDRLLFLQAQGDGDPLSGKAKSMRNASSWRGLRYAYSHWLGFLMVRHPGLLDLPAQQRVRKDIASEYSQFLAVTSNQMSISIELQRLYLVIRELAPQPEDQWNWLWLLSRRVFKTAPIVPRRSVDATALYAAGEALMRRAQQQVDDVGYVSEHAAISYRRGLQVALAALVPERKRVWQCLRLGVNIRKIGPGWRIIVEAEDSKEGKPSRHRVPNQLWPWIDDYVGRFRPVLAGDQGHDGFWASRSGRPMSANTIYQSVTTATKTELGTAVTPHEFRRAVATHWDRTAPDDPQKAQRHLTHANFRMTKKHYIVPSGYAGLGLLNAWKRYSPQDSEGGVSTGVAATDPQSGRVPPEGATWKGHDGAAS
jgi:integrase